MRLLLNPKTVFKVAYLSSWLTNLPIQLSSTFQQASPSLIACQIPAVARCFCSNVPVSTLMSPKASSVLSVLLAGETDQHNGVTVDLAILPPDTEAADFLTALIASMQAWRTEGKVAAWLRVPIHLSHLTALAARQGFTFHHAEGSKALLKVWLPEDKPDLTPQFATHQVGVSGVVVREDTRELLVVQDKNRRFSLWKFPGGLADLGEDIATTAMREVFEETGVETEFQSILAFRQQHRQPGAFGRSDLYFLCRMRPLGYELRPCSQEIRECCWMTVEQLRREVDKSSITVRVTDLVLRGLDDGFENVDIVGEEHTSIHKGLKFHMFLRPLSDAVNM